MERFYELTTAIKAAVRRDRITYLEELAGRVTLQDLRQPKELSAAARRAFPKAGAARCTKFQPLPAVRMQDGTLAQTPHERIMRWTEFFQAQEGGTQVKEAAYLAVFADPHIDPLPEGPVFSTSDTRRA